MKRKAFADAAAASISSRVAPGGQGLCEGARASETSCALFNPCTLSRYCQRQCRERVARAFCGADEKPCKASRLREA